MSASALTLIPADPDVAFATSDQVGDAYRSYGAAISRVATRLVNDPLLAEDIVQEVFLHLWRHPSFFTDPSVPLKARLIVLTRSRAIDAFRSRHSHLRNEQWSALDPDTNDAGRSSQLRVRHALSRLPIKERQAIEFAFYRGLTYREVADALKIPEGTVKTRIRSGLRHLRPLLIET